MNWKCALLWISGTLAIAASAAIVVRHNAESVSAAITPDPEFEIGQDLYALLADDHAFPSDQLDQVRRLLIDDGRISLREFESLGLPVKLGLNSKQQLLKRLNPEPMAGVFLHSGEPRVPNAFSVDVCRLAPPRTQTDPVEMGGSTYQLRHLHYCGWERVSGFSIYRNGEEVNCVRHFGLGSAEVFVTRGKTCYVRRDLTSAEAYRLLQAFYDGTIGARDFISAIIEPTNA